MEILSRAFVLVVTSLYCIETHAMEYAQQSKQQIPLTNMILSAPGGPMILRNQSPSPNPSSMVPSPSGRRSPSQNALRNGAGLVTQSQRHRLQISAPANENMLAEVQQANQSCCNKKCIKRCGLIGGGLIIVGGIIALLVECTKDTPRDQQNP